MSYNIQQMFAAASTIVFWFLHIHFHGATYKSLFLPCVGGEGVHQSSLLGQRAKAVFLNLST